MQIRTIVTVVAATLLSVGLVPTSSAQDNNGSAQDGIEVITIIGKRPVPTVASACVNEVMARIADSARSQHADASFSSEAQDDRRASMISMRRDVRRCIEQAAAPVAAQI